MGCKPCEERRRKRLEQAGITQNKPNKVRLFYKGNQERAQVKIEGRIPVFCEAFQKWCLDAVYQKCDRKTCLIGTPAFDKILSEYDKSLSEE